MSSRRRKKRNLRTDDSLKGPSLRLMYQSFSRHPPALHRGFPSLAAACRECVTRRESARIFFPSALGGTFLRFSVSLSFLTALCLFLFSPTPDAANCAHPDEILVPSAPLATLCSSRLFLPLLLTPIHLPRKRRNRTTAALFARARRNHGFFIFADCSRYCGGADDHSLLGDIMARQSIAWKLRLLKIASEIHGGREKERERERNNIKNLKIKKSCP